MRQPGPWTIIGVEMRDTTMAELTPEEEPVSQDADPGHHMGSIPTTVAISGDKIVGQALALLLQNSHYDVTFLPVAALNESRQLDNVRLLLVTPTQKLSGGRREALLTLLKNTALAANMSILVLSSISGETQGSDWIDPECVVSWPCSTQELERRIEEILASQATADPNREVERDGQGLSRG